LRQAPPGGASPHAATAARPAPTVNPYDQAVRTLLDQAGNFANQAARDRRAGNDETADWCAHFASALRRGAAAIPRVVELEANLERLRAEQAAR
jgi:hypothetical protein